MHKTVLILGSFSKGALEHQYVRGFLNNNWEVEKIDIQITVHEQSNKHIVNKIVNELFPNLFLTTINNVIIEKARSTKPIVVLIFKGMEIKPETILELKQHCKLICNYNPDHPFNFYSKGAGNKNVKDSINLYDIYFSYSTAICKQLMQHFNVNSYCIPFGYDETVIPLRSLTDNISNQFLFIGAWDKEREYKLTKLAHTDLQIFGPSNWGKKINKFGKLKYNSEPLYEQEYANACLNAAGILNFLRPQNITEQSHNMRTFEVPGYGGLLIAERTTEQLDFFEEDKEAIYFDDIIELNDKLKYLKDNQKTILKLKKNAFTRSLNSGYDYNSRTKQFIDHLEKYI